MKPAQQRQHRMTQPGQQLVLGKVTHSLRVQVRVQVLGFHILLVQLGRQHNWLTQELLQESRRSQQQLLRRPQVLLGHHRSQCQVWEQVREGVLGLRQGCHRNRWQVQLELHRNRVHLHHCHLQHSCSGSGSPLGHSCSEPQLLGCFQWRGQLVSCSHLRQELERRLHSWRELELGQWEQERQLRNLRQVQRQGSCSHQQLLRLQLV